MQKESAVIALLAAQQREWRTRFPGLTNRAHQAIVGYLCTRARTGAPVRQLYGVTKELFLLDDATVRERVDEILRLGLAEADSPNDRLSGRSIVIPTEPLLTGFDAYLCPLAGQMAAIEGGQAPPLTGPLSDRDRQALLSAFDAYANTWLSATERFLAAAGLSPARRAEARRRLSTASYWLVMHAAIEHADAMRLGKAEEDCLVADQLAANVLEQTGQGFQTIRDHITWLLNQGLLLRHPGRGLRVSLAEGIAPYFDAALTRAAADFTEVAQRLGTTAQVVVEADDMQDQTIRLALPDDMQLAPPEPVHFLEIVAPEAEADRFVLPETPLVIGRAPPAGLLLRDGAVSRAHCRVELSGGEVRVTDLNSTNGTFVDGDRIQEPRVLEQGATLTIGPYTLVYGCDASEASDEAQQEATRLGPAPSAPRHR